MKYSVDIVKSQRKSISISVRPDGKVTVHAPMHMSFRDIQKFVDEKSDWITKTLEKCHNPNNYDEEPLSDSELKELTEKAKIFFPDRVAYYAEILGIDYKRVSIRTQKTRWGSCTSEGNLNFNCLLMMMPERVRDSVIVHELCHRKEMNHSKRFYDLVIKAMPDYYEMDRWLKQNGTAYLARLYKKENKS